MALRQSVAGTNRNRHGPGRGRRPSRGRRTFNNCSSFAKHSSRGFDPRYREHAQAAWWRIHLRRCQFVRACRNFREGNRLPGRGKAHHREPVQLRSGGRDLRSLSAGSMNCSSYRPCGIEPKPARVRSRCCAVKPASASRELSKSFWSRSAQRRMSQSVISARRTMRTARFIRSSSRSGMQPRSSEGTPPMPSSRN